MTRVVQVSSPVRNGSAVQLIEELNIAPVIASLQGDLLENREYLRESGLIKCC